MGRKSLFVTTDQQRFDALGCNGGTIARTPTVDRLAAEGIVDRRACAQNTVCMLARCTMLTGQHVRTRWMRGDTGPWRGFEYSIQSAHVAAFRGRPIQHYGRWLDAHHPEHLESFAPLLGAAPGGDTMAPETTHDPIPRARYHTDWTADHAIARLDSLDADDDWFCWLSLPDPHHPWDPPHEEMHRVRWQDLDLPPGHPGSPAAAGSATPT